MPRQITYTIDDNGCHICTSHTANADYSYPNTYFRGKCCPIHRMNYILAKGEIPEDKIVRHTCDNRMCINPDHLILGTHKDNSQDREIRNRRNQRGIKHPRAKLTEEQVVKIFLSNKTNKELGEEYNMTPTTIYWIKNGKQWKEVTKNIKK